MRKLALLFVRSAKALFTLPFLIIISLSANAQKTVTGKVTDASTGQPVIGTTVSVKGTKLATQTDNDGNYTISVPNSAKALIFTTIGFESQDILINGQAQISVSLKTMFPS